MNLAIATGKRTKELLFQKSMSQYRLQKITCLNEKTITDLIKGRTSDVKLSTVYVIASAFGMTLSEFTASPIFNSENIEI